MGLLDALPEDSIDVALEVLGTVRQFGWNLYDDTVIGSGDRAQRSDASLSTSIQPSVL
ncbi:hypothetical protein [Paraburkholderia xenovorans]